MSLSSAEINLQLDKLLSMMQEKGLMLNVTNRSELIQTVTQNILKVTNISKENMLDPKFIKGLCLSLMSQHISELNPAFNFDYTKLFNENLLMNVKDQKQEFKMLFLILLKELNNISPKKFNDKALDDLATQLADKAIDNYLTAENQYQNSMHENDRISNSITELLSQAMRNLYGGIDPTKSGEEIQPVEEIIGNLFGIPNPSPNKDGSMAFIDEINRYNAGADPQGINFSNLIMDVSSGFVETFTLMSTLRNEPPHET